MTELLRYSLEDDEMVPVTQEWVDEMQQMIGAFAAERAGIHELTVRQNSKVTKKQLRAILNQAHGKTAPGALRRYMARQARQARQECQQ